MSAKLPPIPVLDTPRLRLRTYADTDVDALFALYADPRVTRYWSFAAWTERVQAEAYLERVRRERRHQEFYPWVIARREDDRMVGTTTLFSLSREHARCELGYSLQSAHWGRGYAREAVGAALGFAFEGLGLQRIESDIDPRNRASCNLVEKFGFQREGLLRERWRVAGETTDSLLYGLLKRGFVRPA
ncbi:MAG: GNAT family N-acetyltransferase [Tahibacter sp.]